MKKALCLFLLCLALVSQTSKYLAYLQCRLMITADCDCVEYLLAPDSNEGEPLVPKHNHTITEEYFFCSPGIPDPNNIYISRPSIIFLQPVFILTAGKLSEVDHPPELARLTV